MNTRKSSLITACLLFVGGSRAFAQDLLHGANIEAVGGASIAHVADNATIATNPAMLAMAPRYDFAGSLFGQPSGDLGWNLNAMDSSKGILGFGAGWTRTITDPPLSDADLPGWVTPGVDPTNKRRASLFSVAMAIAPGDRKFSVGIGGTMGTVSHDRLGSKLMGEMSFGLGYRATDEATFGLVAQGLLPVDNVEAQPVQVLLGTRYALEDGPSIAFETGWQFEDANGLGFISRVGVEAVAGIIRPRLGYSYEGAERKSTVTAGIGGENPSGGLDAAVLVPLGKGFSGRDIRGVITLRLRT